MPGKTSAPVKLSLPLEFQQDIFRELREEDELVVLARGLGLLRVVTNLLHSYDAAGDNLILLVGADERENGWVGESLAEHAAISMSSKAKGLSVVNTDVMSVGAREEMYSKGGVFSITSRILIVDFLSGLLDPATVTGIVVLHAERVVATSLEAFILRIYRQKNKVGFLKAFSDQSEPFTTGFAPLATMMRNLFLRRPSLWPRFHVTISKSLEGKKKAEVIELEVPMTQSMMEIQNAVMECVEVSISELKKANTGLDMEDWNLDNALHKNFDSIVRRQLDPVWHRTSFRTRQIVRDLTLLRQILHSVLTDDAVSFNKHLDTILAASSPPPGTTRQNQSPWLFMDAAQILFETARRRVYTGKLNDKTNDENSNLPQSLQPVLEEQPKWGVLAETLDEIEKDTYLNPIPVGDSNSTTLIMGGDQASCRQIREFLQTMFTRTEQDSHTNGNNETSSTPSASFMMRRKLRNYLSWKKEFAKVSAALFAENEKEFNAKQAQDSGKSNRGSRAPPTKRRRVRGGASAGSTTSRDQSGGLSLVSDRDAHVASLMAALEPTSHEALQKEEIAVDELTLIDEAYELYDMRDLIVVHPFDGDMDEHILEEVKPRYIIMYEPDTAFIRRVEVYRSSHTDRQVRVYFMYYGGSVEEQRYLSAVRREKDAFTKLIRERGSMALTLTADASTVDDPQERFLRTVNTRIAGGGRLAATAQPPRVVVDVREFRSSLPSLLHGRSLEIVPCTLTVGDYILSPTICIERKSVRDLIQSFQSGRLYNQAESMTQHYKDPMLLIEFDQNKSFTLEPFADLTASGSSSMASLDPNKSSDIQSKLVLLTLAFPRLKIIWSSSPYQTAEIFEELKKNQDEPDPLQAVGIGLEEGQTADDQTFAQAPREMLRTIPGVTMSNLTRLTIKVDSIAELANMSEKELEPIVGIEAGRQMNRFFNRSVFDDQ